MATHATTRDVNVALHPHQLAAFTATDPEVYLITGAGGGKTKLGALWALDRCLRNPVGTAGMIAAPTYPVLEQSTMRRFFDELDEMGISYSRNRARNTCEISGRLIFFRSTDKPESLVGADLAWLWLDEAALMDRMAFIRAFQRVRDPRAALRQRLCTTTPEGTRTWVHEREQRPDVRVIRASTLDNKSLTPDVIDGLRSLYANDPAGWRQYVEGIATDLTGNIYTNLSAANVQEFAGAEPEDDVIVGWDFNVHWMATPVAVYRPRTNTTHVIGEVISKSVNGITTEEHAAKVAAYLVGNGMAVRSHGRLVQPVTGVPLRAFIDASGKAKRSSATFTDEAAVYNAGFAPRSNATNPLVRDRIATMQRALQERRLLLDPKRAPDTLQSLRDHARDKYGEPRKTWSVGEFQADHACDAVGYIVCGLHPYQVHRSGT